MSQLPIKTSVEEHRKRRRVFIKHLSRNVGIGLFVILFSLFIGMCGYHYFEKLSWLDAYLNAAMILAGMGPVDPVVSVEGKLFAATYALFSGIIFLIVIAVMMAPIIHRFLCLMHVEEANSK